jgi:hypothetical protein
MQICAKSWVSIGLIRVDSWVDGFVIRSGAHLFPPKDIVVQIGETGTYGNFRLLIFDLEQQGT